MTNTSSFFDAAPRAPGRHNGRLAPVPQEVRPAVEGTHLKELVRMLRRNRLLIFTVTATFFATSAYLAFSGPPIYEAHAVIRLADVRRAFTGGFDDYATQEPLGTTTNPITSELEVLLGRAVLGEVVDREGLRLMIDPRSRLSYRLLSGIRIPVDTSFLKLQLQFRANDFTLRTRGASITAAYGRVVTVRGLTFVVTARPPAKEATISVVPREVAINALSAALRVVPRGNTNAVSVRYKASDPFYAQKVVNAAVEVFKDVNARSARQQAQRRRQFLEAQLSKNYARLATVQQEFGAFQAREQLYSSETKFTAQEQDLIALALRREELDADRRTFTTLLSQLERVPAAERSRVLFTLVSTPGIATNSVITQLYTQRSEYLLEIERLTTGSLGSTSSHPDVQRLHSLLAATETRLLDALRGHVAAVDARVAALDGLRQGSTAQMRRFPAMHAEELRLNQQLETNSRVSDKLAAELQDARMAEAVEMGQVEIVYLAPIPIQTAGPGPWRKLAVGLVLGLIFGGVGAFARETLNTSIRRRDEIEELLRVPELALIPPLVPRKGMLARMRGWASHTNGNGRGHPGSARPLIAAGAEAYRMLRTSVVFAQPQPPLKCVAVTSAISREGVTTTAANLGISFAEQGARVVLVDCNLHAPDLHEIFGAQPVPGLTDILPNGVLPTESVQSTAYEQLFLLSAGSGARPATTLNEHRLAVTLGQLSRAFDLVILDSPAVLEAADATLIGRMADGCILVVRAGETERSLARQAQEKLTLLGVRMLGVVLNDPAGKAADGSAEVGTVAALPGVSHAW